MSEDPILAALARLEAGLEALAGRIDKVQHEQQRQGATLDRVQHEQERQGAVLDRTEGRVDKLASDIAHLGPRLSQMETDFGGQYVRAATANNRLDALDVRVGLIERRLELRERP